MSTHSKTDLARHLQAFAGVISSLPAGKPAKKKKPEGGAKLSTDVPLIFATSDIKEGRRRWQKDLSDSS